MVGEQKHPQKTAWNRGSRLYMFFKIGVLNIFENFTEKHLSLFDNVAGLNACNSIKKRLDHRYFSVRFAKHLRWLLLLREKNNDKKHVSPKNHLITASFKILWGLKEQKNLGINYIRWNLQLFTFCGSKHFFQLTLVCAADSRTGVCSRLLFQKLESKFFFCLDCTFW